ncbi:MAG: molybdopterin biosynthesis protein [Desulfofustis sp.]|nr:molybdopterin biosynthesis protein [Desulfofustis sp.]
MNRESIYVANQPLSEALKIWEQALKEIGFGQRRTRVIPVDEALGETTARAVYASHSSPTYNASAMDGVAVRFEDLGFASEASPVVLKSDQYQSVNTGNEVPDRFNAVVMIEDVHTRADGSIELINSATPWQHIRTVGEDIVATELILPAGHTIRPIDQGAMLASGVAQVEVNATPKVTVIPTGSELIAPGSPGKPGQIIEFNSRILAGYLREWGAEVSVLSPVSDDPELITEALLEAVKRSDIVVTNAGASAGTRDFSSTVLASAGRVVVRGVAIKPGKPVILALVDSKPVIGLPGYPISAILTLQLFARDLVYRFRGQRPPSGESCNAIMSRPMHSPMGVDQFVRVTLGRVHDTLIATPSGKGAGSVMSLVRADGLLTIPVGSEGIGAGETVRIELMRPMQEVDRTLVAIGSHDNILDLMANGLHQLDPPIRLSSAHVGSMGGIMAIRRGEAHFGGTHLLDEQTGEYNIPFIKRFLAGMQLRLVNLCYRQQGFIVAKGNPKAVRSFTDIVERKLLFINRQKGAGTRLLTDKIIRESGLDPGLIAGYDHEEYTHMNIAVAVMSGSADVGMGIRAAAVALGLDFVPVAEERYDLIVPEAFVDDKRMSAAFDLIQDQQFMARVETLGGYSLRHCGNVIYRQ